MSIENLENEELNVTEEIEETEEDLFDDNEDVTSEDDHIEEDTADHSGNVTEEFELKYLDEVKKVSKDELITLGQKGLNYDKVKTELDNLRNYKDDIKFIDELVEESGLSKEEYFKSVRENMSNVKINSRIEELIENGLDEETAKYTAKLELENQSLKAVNKKAEQKKAVEAEKIKSIEREIADFQRIYPDVTKLPESVATAVNQGENLITAYQRYLIEEQNTKIKQLEKSVLNKEKSVGSLKNQAYNNGKKDDFLSALFDD